MKPSRSLYSEMLPHIQRMRREGADHQQIATELHISRFLVQHYIKIAKRQGIPIAKGLAIQDDWYEGKVCPKGHDNGNGHSWRRGDGKCIECIKEYQRKYGKQRYQRSKSA